MAFKPMIFDYQAKNFQTGLSDVTADIYKNGSATPVATAVPLTERGGGSYTLVVSSANMVTWGFAAGDILFAVIDSTGKPARSEVKEKVSAVTTDDLEAHLASQDTAIAAVKTELDTVASDVATTKADAAAIKSDVESGTFGLAAIKTELDSIQSAVGNLQNNTTFEVAMPEGGLIKPQAGSRLYRLPIRVMKTDGSVQDPDSNSIVVSLANPAGVDRGSMLTGYSGGSAPAVRDSAGVYHIDLTLPAGATEEELLFTFEYAISSVSFNKVRSVDVVNNVQADGFALETTAQAIKTSTDDMQPRVAAIESAVTDVSTGLAAIKAAAAAAKTAAEDAQAKINDASIGLAAIKSAVDSKASQASVTSVATAVTGVQTDVTAIKGAGFDGADDSLHQLSLYLRANLFSGGRAI